MSYTFPSVAINNMTFTALRWGQFPTITYIAGGTAGSEVVTVATDLSNITVKIEDGVSTNLQIKNAIAASYATVKSLMASDLVSIAITSGHNSDAASAVTAQTMTGAGNVPAPSNILPPQDSPASYAIPSTVIDWSKGRLFSKTLAADTTLTFVNAVDGMSITVAITNTSGNYTVTWPTMKWTGGSAPTQTVGAKTDVYTLRKIGSTIYATAVQDLS